jgi:hypothetical protein
VLLAATAYMVFEDTVLRSRNSTYINIASQMQYHTQRLAKAAGLAARGQAAAFPQLPGQPRRIRQLPDDPAERRLAFDVTVPGAATTEELRAASTSSRKRWPETANAATAILTRKKDLVGLAQNIAQIRAARRRWRPSRRS